MAAEKKLHKWWSKTPLGRVQQYRNGDIVCGDARDVLGALRHESADILFLDPPFNLGKTYGHSLGTDDRLPEDAYSAFMADVLVESARVLKPGGSLYLYHIPRFAIRFASILERHLSFRHWIAISMKNGFARGNGLYPAHYALLHYSKGRPKVSNRPKIDPATCPHCGEYTRDYGGYRKHIENGVNLTDVWEDLSPVRHQKYKRRRANELPLAIPRRVVEMSGYRGGLLVDPFAGTGTSLVAARLAGMQFVACDREDENVALIEERLRSLSKRPKATTIL